MDIFINNFWGSDHIFYGNLEKKSFYCSVYYVGGILRVIDPIDKTDTAIGKYCTILCCRIFKKLILTEVM